MSNRILTVTLNPAIDQTVNLATLTHGAVNIAQRATTNAGGKGVNVAACLADWGVPVQATGILGRDDIASFEALFHKKGIENQFIVQDGSIRTNIKLVSQDDGETTDVNLPGTMVSYAVFEQLTKRLDTLVKPDTWVVLSGSLPPGIPGDAYAQLCTRLTQQGARVILDSSGDALSAALSAQTLPFCIKPNRHEMEQWAGRTLKSHNDIIEEARALLNRGVEQIVVSLAEQGALFIGEQGYWLASPPPVSPVSSVGAGDSLLAGWLAAQHQQLDWQDSIRLAMAFAAGKLAQIGPHLPARAELERLAQLVTVTRITD
jgi:1-phosphofructokinase